MRNLAVGVAYKHDGTPGGKDAVHLAWNDQSFELRQQRHKVDVARSQRVTQSLARLVRYEAKIIESARLCLFAQRTHLRATTDHQKHDIGAAMQPPGGLQHCLDVVGATQVARVRDDESIRQPELPTQGAGRRRHGKDGALVGPVFGNVDVACRDSARGQVVTHPRAEYHVGLRRTERQIPRGAQQ